MVLLLFNALNGEFAKSFASPGNNSVFCQQRPLQNYSDLQNCNCGHKSTAQRLETKPSGTVPKMISELIIQDKSINVKDSTYNFSMILCSCPSSGTWDLLNFCPLISELFPTYVSQSFGIKPNICDILFFLYFLKSGKLSGFVVR